MISPKMPDNVKFSSAFNRLPYELIIHNAGFGTLSPHDEFSAYGPMIRDYNVIRYCVSGHGTLILNDRTYQISPGQCYALLAGDVAYEVFNDPGDPLTLGYVTLLGTRATQYLSRFGISSNHPFFSQMDSPALLEKIGELAKDDYSGERAPITEFKRCAEAYYVMQLLHEIFLSSEKPQHSTEHMQEQYVSEALNYMDMHYAQKITVSDIASHIGINRSYFYSLFKQHTGIPPQEHLTRLRIYKACELFEYPNSTVVNVANALNLESSVFFRHFKRITGKTPSEYKHEISKKQKQGGTQQ